MIEFDSVSVRIADTKRAVDECVETLDCTKKSGSRRYYVVNAAIGHRLEKVVAGLKAHNDKATVLATSCGGVIGREGAGESMTHLAVMEVTGSETECAHAYANGITPENSYEKAKEAATEIKKQLPGVSAVYLLSPGLNARSDLIIEAFNDVLGEKTVVFGGLSADNYKAVASFQSVDSLMCEDMLWALGMQDDTIKIATKANHGFVAYGAPMTATNAENNLLIELNNAPAWAAYSKNTEEYLKKSPVEIAQVLGALAVELPPHLATEYGNSHILRSAAAAEIPGAMKLTIGVKTGDQFYMTMRDEELIFSEQENAMAYLTEKIKGHKAIAVFQTDCIARGKTLFNRVMKDELIGVMQHALMDENGAVPPWLGMYGFGEYCPLGGRNVFHTYTTSLMVLYR